MVSKGAGSEMRRSFFTRRVVGIWNALPGREVEADSIGAFKRELDTYLKVIDLGGLRRQGWRMGLAGWLFQDRCRHDGPNGLLLFCDSITPFV